jgi:large subunit ribosomal protein L3
MVKGLWGRKIGMTQVFSDKQQVVPVTVIDVAHWYVTQIKTKECDGYSAVKMGRVKEKYTGQDFSTEWLKEPRKYFSDFKEVPFDTPAEAPEVALAIGNSADLATVLTKGDNVDVFGITRGLGFQGVVKRHDYAGGRATHGSKFHRRPGGMSCTRSRGRVFKGKGLPGHMGTEQRCMKNLEIIKIEPEARVVLVKGSVPGKSGSLVYVRKSR